MDNLDEIQTVTKALPLRLKIARLSRGFLSRNSFAKFCGASVTTYRAHELGENELKASDVTRYATALNISCWWLLTGKGDPLAHIENVPALDKAKFKYHIQVEQANAAIIEEAKRQFNCENHE